MNRNWDIVWVLQKKRKISEFWAQLRLFANVVIKRGQVEKQQVVYQELLVRRKTLQISVNWFVQKKIRLFIKKIKNCRSSVQRIVKRALNLTDFVAFQLKIISESVKQTLCEWCQKLIHRLPTTGVNKVVFTDENNFYLNPPVKHLNNCVCSAGNLKIRKVIFNLF